MFSSNSSQVSSAVNYIEEVFSTYLYEGNGATQQIVNNIDLSTKGGLIWTKSRSNAYAHALFDTVRGGQYRLTSNDTTAPGDQGASVVNFNTDGYTWTSTGNPWNNNIAANNLYVGWTFREQPKFFDIVTWSGSGINTTIPHSLGSVPGSIIVKRTDTNAAWAVYHRSLANTEYLVLNTTAATATGATWWNSTTPTSAVFSVGTDATVNASGGTYIAYVFAHNAGGFGLTGTDNVISCGSFTTDGSGNATVTLGYEPQWIMFKSSSSVLDWSIQDTMRGSSLTTYARLAANSSNVEFSGNVPIFAPNATGFTIANTDASTTFIYIAIRRGPMKVPTLGTSVFSPFTTAGATGTAVTTNFPVDFQLYKYRAGIDYFFAIDRLRGVNSTTTANASPWLDTTAATDEVTINTNVSRNWGNTGFEVPGIVGGASNVFYSFRRAPGFFDEVCYTGTGSNTTKSHNLGVVPELWIVKGRNAGSETWNVGCTALAATERIILASTAAKDTVPTMWNSTYPTSTVFSIGTAGGSNSNTYLYVAYFFATCAGVSKVGSYTGNGTTQTINCGFTGGARFVLIKRTDSTGDWYTYDTARGMTVLTDPYLFLNSTAAETATLGSVTTVSTGFALNSTILAAINISAGTYIFLAIA